MALLIYSPIQLTAHEGLGAATWRIELPAPGGGFWMFFFRLSSFISFKSLIARLP